MRKRITALLYGALTAFIVPAIAATQTHDTAPKTQNSPPEEKVELKQSYTGVVPGNGNNLPRVEKLKKQKGAWVTWPGFVLREDGGSRLFVQTTQPLQYSVSDNGLTVTLSLKKTKVYLSNNQNPLVTSYFNTPLKRAYFKKGKKETLLVLELKVKATPNISSITDNDGYHYMFVDFSPGDYPVDSDPLVPSFIGVGGAHAGAASSSLPQGTHGAPRSEGGSSPKRIDP